MKIRPASVFFAISGEGRPHCPAGRSIASWYTPAAMFRPARHRRLLAGILLFALMLQSLLPAMAGVLTEGSGRWIEVCAGSGVKWVKIDQQAADGEHAYDGQCLLCAATGALPEFDARRHLQAHGSDARPAVMGTDPRRVFPGHALRSRAPPVLS